MARPLRINFPGALYHITARGNEKKNIYFCDEDRHHFLRMLAKAITRFNWVCYDYCLMCNHYHLVIETPLANLSQGMKYLNGMYSQYINWRYKRVGHLFQGRFHAILVEKESHWLEVCRYVVLNPVRAGICDEAEDYIWSSYRAHRGLVSTPAFLTSSAILPFLGPDLKKSQEAYEVFVKNGKEARPFDHVRGQIFLGSEAFIASFQEDGRKHRGIPKSQTDVLRPSLKTILPAPDGLKSAKTYGYSSGEVARQLGVHQTTAARRMRQCA